MGYLFWHKGRWANEAAWRWRFGGVPPADAVIEALPEGQLLLVIPRRERYAANRAYAVDVLPIPPDVVSEVELQRALWVIPRRELRSANTAYELRDNSALRPDRERPIEIGQLESRSWRWPLRTAATAYTLYDAPQLRPDRDKPIEIGALWPHVFQPRRTAATAYGLVVIPIAEGFPLPEELRRSILIIPTRLRLAARSAYDLYQFQIVFGPDAEISGALATGRPRSVLHDRARLIEGEIDAETSAARRLQLLREDEEFLLLE